LGERERERRRIAWCLSGRRQEQSILNVTFVCKHQINVLETADSQTFEIINVAKTSTMLECHSVVQQGTPGLHDLGIKKTDYNFSD